MIAFAIGVLIGISIALIFISLMFKDEIQFIPSDQLPPGWKFNDLENNKQVLISTRV